MSPSRQREWFHSCLYILAGHSGNGYRLARKIPQRSYYRRIDHKGNSVCTTYNRINSVITNVHIEMQLWHLEWCRLVPSFTNSYQTCRFFTYLGKGKGKLAYFSHVLTPVALSSHTRPAFSQGSNSSKVTHKIKKNANNE